jgi:hypothetical protein
MWQRLERNMGRRREGDECTKGVKERQKEGERLRHKINEKSQHCCFSQLAESKPSKIILQLQI